MRPLRISEEDLAKIGRISRPSLVRYREELGGGYLVSLEISHHMHCLVSKLDKNPNSSNLLASMSIELDTEGIVKIDNT